MRFSRLNYAEPAVLRGIVTAVVALAASLGFVTSTDAVDGAADVLVPIVSFLLPLLQSLWTRASVFAPKTVDQVAGRHEAH
jgi:hypothetical protein